MLKYYRAPNAGGANILGPPVFGHFIRKATIIIILSVAITVKTTPAHAALRKDSLPVNSSDWLGYFIVGFATGGMAAFILSFL